MIVLKESLTLSEIYLKKEKDKSIDKLLQVILKMMLLKVLPLKETMLKKKKNPILMDILLKLLKMSLNYNIIKEIMKKKLKKVLIFHLFLPAKKLP
jgi:hypothetical protein